MPLSYDDLITSSSSLNLFDPDADTYNLLDTLLDTYNLLDLDVESFNVLVGDSDDTLYSFSLLLLLDPKLYNILLLF